MDSRSGRLDTVHRFTAEPVVVGTGDRAGAITLAPSRFAIDVGMWRSPGTQRRGLGRAERDIGRGDAYIRSIEFEKSVIAMRTKVLTGSFAPDFAGALTAVLLLLIGTIYWATSSSAETAESSRLPYSTKPPRHCPRKWWSWRAAASGAFRASSSTSTGSAPRSLGIPAALTTPPNITWSAPARPDTPNRCRSLSILVGSAT